MITTVGQVLFNEALPEKYRDYQRVVGADELEDIMSRIAVEDPDSYKDASAKLMRHGNRVAYEEGTTLRLSSLEAPIDRSPIYNMIDAQEDSIVNNPDLTEKEKEILLDNLYEQANDLMKKQTYSVSSKAGNPFALQVKSKARGNQDQLAAMISSPGIYKDTQGKTVPMFIRHSFAEGVTPAEYWAGSYGARTGIVSTKFATRKGGELGKLLASASIDNVITVEDCGTHQGIPVKAADKDNLGCVLAEDIGDFKAGTIITKQVMSALSNAKVDDILVRSPLTCTAKDGTCSHCAGIRENGKFPEIGYNLGINGASALSERVAQGALNVKHSGKKAEGASRFSGFDMIKAMATVPGTYPDRATVAELDGKVTKIEKAPQGGSFVYVNDTKHYVPSGYEIYAKEGDELEAGDQISEGVINPVDVVKYKGIGEGRRYFMNRFTQAFRDSGYKVNRRNVEVVAKSLVNHVQIDDEDSEGSNLPGDVVTYSNWSHGYKPREGSVMTGPGQAIGSYLEQPALHYSIGTRITNSVANELKKFKVDQIMVNKSPANVTPYMQSVIKSTGDSGDWLARLGTTYLKDRLVSDAQHGSVSNIHGVNPLPGVAKGTEFGEFFNNPLNKNSPFRY